MPDERRTVRRAILPGVRATFEGATGERQQADVPNLGRGGLFEPQLLAIYAAMAIAPSARRHRARFHPGLDRGEGPIHKISTNGSANRGASSSRIRRTSRPSARRSSARSPSSSPSSTSATSRPSRSASTTSFPQEVDGRHRGDADTKLNYPILGDPDRKVANLYGMIHPNANDTLTVRSVFVIDPNKKVRLTITYPASTGRNFDEILRSSTRSS
jgi:hypothetical protein